MNIRFRVLGWPRIALAALGVVLAATVDARVFSPGTVSLGGSGQAVGGTEVFAVSGNAPSEAEIYVTQSDKMVPETVPKLVAQYDSSQYGTGYSGYGGSYGGYGGYGGSYGGYGSSYGTYGQGGSSSSSTYGAQGTYGNSGRYSGGGTANHSQQLYDEYGRPRKPSTREQFKQQVQQATGAAAQDLIREFGAALADGVRNSFSGSGGGTAYPGLAPAQPQYRVPDSYGSAPSSSYSFQPAAPTSGRRSTGERF